MTDQPLKAAVIGGSVGGLTAAIQLRSIGCDVDVYERSTGAMTSKGGGIVLQDNMISWYQDALGIDIATMSARTDYLRYFDRDGNVLINRPMVWLNTSWSTIYSRLFQVFGHDHYHRGRQVLRVDQEPRSASLVFESGVDVTADLVVFADGVRSTGRAQYCPNVLPRYAGYVGWRGTVPEADLSPAALESLADSMSYYVGDNTHIVIYPIPGPEGQLEVGQRLINYVWYRNVPEGSELEALVTDKRGRVCKLSVQAGDVQDHFIDELRRDASELLPPVIAEAVLKTKEPFIQILRDILVDRMVHGRAVILGDAAFASRPHAAAGAAKAVADAIALSAHLVKADFDVDAALANWEPTQLAIGRNLVKRVREMGARSQFENSWVPGDPAFDFGLPGPND
jgi:2,6-dihydroxypyridine 3-monooxygenase